VSEPLLRLGLQPDRTVEVPAPKDAAYPGWYELGPTPGQVGSSVILGHVDSLRGPAVFYRLRTLEHGNHVDVRLDSGVVAHFEVQKVVTYPNEDFPARTVYGSHGYPALNLVTCGGAYDRDNGGYQSNVVAYTRLVATTPASR
jgi:sortase (surface protein transpeptidase)